VLCADDTEDSRTLPSGAAESTQAGAAAQFQPTQVIADFEETPLLPSLPLLPVGDIMPAFDEISSLLDDQSPSKTRMQQLLHHHHQQQQHY